MTPLDFMDFRDHLSSASGFQSLQFRLLENKMGVLTSNRVKYNKSNYREVFSDVAHARDALDESEEELSLGQCVERWLERTPGLEESGFNFPAKFRAAVEAKLANDLAAIEAEPNETVRTHLMNNLRIKKQQFDTIFDPALHQGLVERGERRFSHKAMLGVIMINLYKEEPRFHQPSLLLEELMNIEVEITKWRCKYMKHHLATLV